MSVEERLQDAVNAYNWEQDQIQRWRYTLHQVTGQYPNNILRLTFEAIWDRYFDAVWASNDEIIQHCQDALNSHDPDAIQAAAQWLNNPEHLRGPLVAIHNEAHAHEGVSGYLGQLDRIMNLEVVARDDIVQYVLDGISPPPPP